MAYKHIDNLYKNQDILLFRECYATEKVHGTSAHIKFQEGELSFFSGGIKHSSFVDIFNQEGLLSKFVAIGPPEITVYGEAYGGKIMKMSDTYGKELSFIAFEIKIGEDWLNVPNAEAVALSLGLEFVPYIRIPTDLNTINSIRDLPSEVAIRRGCGSDKPREGIVLRPIIEVRKNNNERIVAKHKSDAFAERHHQPRVKKEQTTILAEANEIASEWVTEMRLTHVLDRLSASRGGGVEFVIQDTGEIVKAMIEDVLREANKEIEENKRVRTAIGKRTAQMFKRRIAALIG